MSKQKSVATLISRIQKYCPEVYRHYSPTILRVHRIHFHLQNNLMDVLYVKGLQQADFEVLISLLRGNEDHCLSPTELSQNMLFSSGGLTKVLCRVTQAGLVERLDLSKDKRCKLVKLTEKGRCLINDIMQLLHVKHDAKMSVLDVQEQAKLNTLLDKLLGTWE
ncbi:MarR family transcriptional regulator [Psychromonas sp. CNPT3]|uniref:MarR family winged helix-turn-helix transcriptional regulator n=1 Tax=Psychromonas sp. CNPT3 TaxID=314282 RepID=UPI00006E9E6A|nr:MarR family transcriptional regulator [Psychromonas sp. CNPT3]AGH80286.1 MarR family transcriptional regulator [Psychromonas sp. CNPT3]